MDIYLRRALAVLILLSLSAAGASAKSLRMTSVVYGNLEANRVCDATSSVAALCNGKSQCNVNVRNTSLCGDPDFLTVKKIRIEYQCGRSRRRMIVDEYKDASIECN